MSILTEIIQYFQKKKENFEISRFDGDIFTLNHTAFQKTGLYYNFPLFLFYPKNDPKGYWFGVNLRSPRIYKIGNRLFKKYINDPSLLKEKFYLLQNDLHKTFEILVSKPVNHPNFFKKTYFDFAKKAQKFGLSTLYPLEILERFLEKKLSQLIPNEKEREILTFPLYSSYIQEREEQILKIIKSLPKREISLLKNGVINLNQYFYLKQSLKEFQRNFGWTFLNYASFKLPSLKDLLKWGVEIAKNLNLEKEKIEEIKKKREIKLKILKDCPLKIKKAINLLDTVFELRDQRKATWLKIVYHWKRWVNKLASLYGLSYDDIRWLTHEEQCLLNKKNKKKFLKIINQRRNNCLVCYGIKNKEYLIFTGKKALKIADVLFKKEKEENILKGIPASPGKTMGRIKIILKRSDFRKFKKEEILVTSHTTPDYLPIMKKAKAILTERGGITSHAAIVSRELGIPCVVGIKNLIINLQDGDFIEVDANKGTIKILKK
jgi:phosphohistidine swiveling domain-containing protein